MRTFSKSVYALTVALALGCGGSTSGGTVQFTASGEALALGGYAFPPPSNASGVFVDGWSVQFTKFIAVFDKVRLWQDPDVTPSDQSMTGPLVAEIDGPWAIDLHKGGPLSGKGGAGEQAFPVETIPNQNRNGGAPFDPTVRYAFGFDSVAATNSAKLLQIAAGDPDYADMVTNGWNVLYVGTATWMGTAMGSACQQSGPFDFTQPPFQGTVNFRFGFATPASYINCQNPDNDPAMGVNGEDHERGVQVKSNQTTYSQVTFHTDHPFWESFTHDTPAHFDQLAAQATMDASGHWSVTLDNMKGVNYTAFTARGKPLPWRSCDAAVTGYAPPNMNAQMGFNSLTIPFNPMGNPQTAMRDYWDYMRYDQSTQGHLNSDGLCYVERHYPSPN